MSALNETSQAAPVGLIGLGVMGEPIALNLEGQLARLRSSSGDQ